MSCVRRRPCVAVSMAVHSLHSSPYASWSLVKDMTSAEMRQPAALAAMGPYTLRPLIEDVQLGSGENDIIPGITCVELWGA